MIRIPVLFTLLILATSAFAAKNSIPSGGFYNFPNPFDNSTESTSFVIRLSNNTTNNISGFSETNKSVVLTLVIYDTGGKKVWTKSISTTLSATNNALGTFTESNGSLIKWGGQNDYGVRVRRGVYFCEVTIEGDDIVTGKLKIAITPK